MSRADRHEASARRALAASLLLIACGGDRAGLAPAGSGSSAPAGNTGNAGSGASGGAGGAGGAPDGNAGGGAGGAGGAPGGNAGGGASGASGGAAGAGGVPGGNSGGGASGGAAGAGGARVPACQPTPILVDDQPSGMVRCADGSLARVTATRCALADLSGEPPCQGGAAGAAPGQKCWDPCLDSPYGRSRPTGYWEPQWHCVYFCAVDADCPSGACACGADGIGRCMPASCGSSASCGADDACRVVLERTPCDNGEPVLRCLTPADECVTHSECPEGWLTSHCKAAGAGAPLRCSTWGAAGCGRRLSIGGKLAVARPRKTDTWC